MKFLDRLFKRGQKNGEAEQALIHGLAVGESQRPLTEQEMLEALGINIHMIEDQSVKDILSGMSYDVRVTEDGKVVPTGDVDINMLAMTVATSKLIRTSYVDPIDAEIGQLEAERFVLRQLIGMDEDTYELGGHNFLDALSQIIKTAWSDAKHGRKAKLLKVMAKSFEVRTPEQTGKEKGWI
ncbi:hypothetical protein DRO45_00140 [Candidatus Bathyarchaeota archaeon]|nr:MAG: hypothetical protein DRO45_00140 [Candidatus Bathyarchaeota archaeon]